MEPDGDLDAALDADLDAALLVALAVPDERDLALCARHLAVNPAAPPESTPGVGPALLDRWRALRAGGAVKAERRRAELLGLELVAWRDPRYPAALRDLAAPPPVLYLRGTGGWPPYLPVTIVGARTSTGRGRLLAADLGRGVAARGGAVVSGLAIGIDQAAHTGAAVAGGACFAVLACGVDQVYPPGAQGLAEQIQASGRLISEMPLGTPPYKSHFPRRNRLLAALARATIVVEADLKSGSLITAHRALDLGRSVHAVPGAIDAPTSRGTNRLIRDGAHPLLEVDDLDLVVGARPRADGASADALLGELRDPVAADALAARVGSAVDVVLLKLVELEADGRITRLGGGLYVRLP